jgi:hypothetical protein
MNIMKFKYCPQCGSMDIKVNALRQETCERCRYTGPMNEGAMDEINRFQKNLKSGSRGNLNKTEFFPKKEDSSSQLKEKMKSLKGKSTDDFEII